MVQEADQLDSWNSSRLTGRRRLANSAPRATVSVASPHAEWLIG
jgi:hypothetical protein